MQPASGRSAVVIDPEGAPRPTADAAQAASAPERFLLSVDDGGQLLVCTGSRIAIGHRSAAVELSFLADVGALHAWLEAGETLADGPRWSLVGAAGERVRVNGEPTGPRGRVLRDGDRLELGSNLRLRFAVPDPRSSCALLSVHGGECLGAARIALWREGRPGRLRIASDARAHVRTPPGSPAVEAVLEPARIVLASSAGLEPALPVPPAQPRAAFPAASPPRVTQLALRRPLRGRLACTIGERVRGRAPFTLSLESLPPLARGAE